MYLTNLSVNATEFCIMKPHFLVMPSIHYCFTYSIWDFRGTHKLAQYWQSCT